MAGKRSNKRKVRKVIKVSNPDGLPTIPYTQLTDFQGDLKTITDKWKVDLAL
jgi:hypothetical protein